MMATETPCTPNHSHRKTKDLDEERSRSDLIENPDIYKMTPSSTRKRQRRIDSSDDESEIDRKTSITDSGENVTSSPEVVCSSSKKKTHVVYSSESEDSGDQEPLGVTPGFSASKGPSTAVRRVKKNLDEAFGKSEVGDDSDLHGDTCSSSNESGSENDGTVHTSLQQRRLRRKSTHGNVLPPEFYGTASVKKAKREKALEALRKKRERRAGGLSGKTTLRDNDTDDEDSDVTRDNTIEKDQGEEEEEEEEEEKEEDLGSDLDDFVVEDSQSQELPIFAKLELEEAYKRLVQMYLSSILDRDFLSFLQDEKDPYFEEAQDSIDKVIESKKNLVGSTTWEQFKEMLQSCSILESHNIKPIIMRDKCEACRRKQRNLTQHIMFFSTDCNGVKEIPMQMEFSVGCFCAERGSLYHDLHHHKSQLRQSCTEKINKLREAMGNESDQNIVQCCINDEEWLNILFKTFEALLNEADKWAEDEEKRKHMKAYCASFH